MRIAYLPSFAFSGSPNSLRRTSSPCKVTPFASLLATNSNRRQTLGEILLLVDKSFRSS
jgi:hypothetical protein